MTININSSLYGETPYSGTIIKAQLLNGMCINLGYCSNSCACNGNLGCSCHTKVHSANYCSSNYGCYGHWTAVLDRHSDSNRSSMTQTATVGTISSGSILYASKFQEIINKIAECANRRNTNYCFKYGTWVLSYKDGTAYSGMIISADYINTIINDLNNLLNNCSCNCHYCSCNCNYCTCNGHCPCTCNYS